MAKKKRKTLPESSPELISTTVFETHFRSFLSFIVASAGFLYLLLDPQYRTGAVNDDAVYVLGARSLVHPWGFHSMLIRPDYPMPGLPILLAPLVKLVEPQWTRLESLSIMVTIGSLLCLAAWVRRFLSPGETLAVVALFAFNRVVAKFSGILMPEIYYTAAILASFLLMSQLREKWTVGKALSLGLVLGWGCLVRP